MIVAPTTDRALIESILYHPVIFENIAEDNAPKELPKSGFLAGFSGETCVGIVIVNPVSKHVAEVHIQVLPEHRTAHAGEFANAAIKWLLGKGFKKLNAQIPFCCENVKRFAERVGFEVEGINRCSWMKNGVLHDSWYLGLRGDQWAGL